MNYHDRLIDNIKPHLAALQPKLKDTVPLLRDFLAVSPIGTDGRCYLEPGDIAVLTIGLRGIGLCRVRPEFLTPLAGTQDNDLSAVPGLLEQAAQTEDPLLAQAAGTWLVHLFSDMAQGSRLLVFVQGPGDAFTFAGHKLAGYCEVVAQ